MNTLLRFAQQYPSTELNGAWQLCATSPGQIAEISQLNANLTWKAIPYPASVAAVLRALEQWTIDDVSLRFDAWDWWYQCDFDFPAQNVPDAVILGLEGLATLAEVWLNGVSLGTSQNMFHAQQLRVEPLLQISGNRLLLVFRSLDQQLKQRRPRPRWRAPMMEHQQLRHVRTSILGRVPGWSPPCPVVGVWRPLWLQVQPGPALKNLHLHTLVEDNCGLVKLSCQLTVAVKAQIILHVSRGQQHFSTPLQYQVDTEQYTANMRIDAVERWWPHTHGEPALYVVKLQVTLSETAEIVTFALGHLGFRRIEVKREQGDFNICVNDVEIFCRGASWMPLDVVSLHADTEDYRTALQQVKAAGMNMLRISGTSCYETESFYSLCDELGIMLWQEFMFAGMDYPEDSEFIASVTLEAQQQLARWQTHPALTILCGNAEVEQQAAMWGAARELWRAALFYQHLAGLAQAWCPGVFYWPSAGHEGAFPHQCDQGTAFYYGFGAYLRPLADTVLSRLRFATECLAIANIPEHSTLKLLPGATQTPPKVHHPIWKMRSPRDLGGAGWDFDDVRDFYLAQFFKIDPLQLRYTDHERYLLLSKITSGEILAQAYINWRSELSTCRGALIWFLRDLWPGAGWGIIDSQGQPKSAYYYVQRVLQPLSVSLTEEGNNGYYVHISNEQPQHCTVLVEVNVYQAGHVLVASVSRTIELNPRQNLCEPLVSWFDGFFDFNHSYRFGSAMADSIYVSLKSPMGDLSSETFAFPSGFASIPMTEIGLQANVSLLEDGNALIHVSCSRLALAVHFDIEGFIPDDAYFHLAPQHSKSILMRKSGAKVSGLYARVGALNALDSVALSVSFG